VTGKSLSQIKNRREFGDAFHAAMSSAHKTLRAFWHFEKDQNLPKSYLVEFHPKHDDNGCHEWTAENVYKTLKKAAPSYGAYVKRTQDESLIYLSHSEQSHTAEFIIDCFDPRFLVFNTISSATSTDRFIFDRLTQYQPQFDLFWLPVAFLEDVENREKVTGWEAFFDPLLDSVEVDKGKDTSNEDGISAEGSQIEGEFASEAKIQALKRPRLNIHLEILNALETYKRLKEVPNLLPDVPLNSVFAERGDENLSYFSRARIKSNGKITGRGTDFSIYNQIVQGTLESYATLVRALESKYWLKLEGQSHEESTGIKLSGEPFCIKFSNEIDVNSLINLMFGCARPFRLMGTPEQIAADYYVIDAIDLHVNQPLSFEISPELLRIYLYEGTCGNTLVRIIKSLQHFVDSRLSHPALPSLLSHQHEAVTY